MPKIQLTQKQIISIIIAIEGYTIGLGLPLEKKYDRIIETLKKQRR